MNVGGDVVGDMNVGGNVIVVKKVGATVIDDDNDGVIVGG